MGKALRIKKTFEGYIVERVEDLDFLDNQVLEFDGKVIELQEGTTLDEEQFNVYRNQEYSCKLKN